MKKLLSIRRITSSLSKLSLKMKLSTLIMFATLFSLHANNTYSQRKITLDMENVTVKTVLDQIESRTNFRFVYKIKDVDLERKVNVKVKDQLVTTVIKDIFKNSELSYNIDGFQVFLLKRKITNEANHIGSLDENIQQLEISGTVLDEGGIPLTGASIIEKGTTNGAQSDFDGNFSLTLTDQNAVLEVSYLGYATKDIPVNGQTSFSIVLTPLPLLAEIGTISIKSCNSPNFFKCGNNSSLSAILSILFTTRIHGEPLFLILLSTNSSSEVQ